MVCLYKEIATAGSVMDEDSLHVGDYAPVQKSADTLLPAVAFMHGRGYTPGERSLS